MRQIFLFSVAGIFLLGCAEQERIPDHVLDKETFSELICDFTLAESAATLNVKSVPFERFDSVYAFSPLQDHKVTRAQFDTSLYFYSHHPELFKEVYALALEKLSQFQSSRK